MNTNKGYSLLKSRNYEEFLAMVAKSELEKAFFYDYDRENEDFKAEILEQNASIG